MKPYGNTRRENGSCHDGCCTLGTVRTGRAHVKRGARKRGRKRARRFDAWEDVEVDGERAAGAW